MESNYQPQPNLASILQTLQAYAPSHQQAPQPPYQSHIPQANTNPRPPLPPQTSDLEEGEYDPSTYDPSLPLITTPHPQTAHPHPPDTHIWNPPPTTSPTPPTPHPAPKPTPSISKPPSETPPLKKTHTPPAYHPSTITTWAPALRHITSQTTSSASFLPRIRHLISTQHAHERQWWNGRLELQTRLAGRAEGRKKLDSVLGSLGGHVGPSSSSDELSSSREMELYDRKVHKACGEMVAATGRELRRLEVPFFCTLEGLVGGEGDGKRKGRVSEAEMGELRGRMMVLLEDLCGGEE